jgi:hypothetical protein
LGYNKIRYFSALTAANKIDLFMKILKQICNFYLEGFKNMTWGKSVWLIILIKLFIFFFVLKIFFFPDILKKNFSTDKERGDSVLENLTNTK